MFTATFDHACAAGCRRLKPHAAVRLLRPGPPETWALRCLGCDRVGAHRLVHLRSPQAAPVACGAPSQSAATRVTGVSCVACLRAVATPLAMELPETRELCNGRCGETEHAWSAQLDARGREVIIPRCQACGQRGPARRLRHLAYSERATWCGLPNAPA